METIGKYQIVRVLGQGGMGRVYEAVDPVIGRRVAIKTISVTLVADEEVRARFFREAQAAGRLSHYNLITIYDIGEVDDSPYIVMEYLEGCDLSRTIRGGGLSFDKKLQVMIDICEGLAYAHGRDIVHRDIKPANIFITGHGQVKILDFGLARGALSEMTETGRIVGTPNYMAPEQIRGEESDHRVDIFAAGVVFYELLSGRKAFEGDSVATTMYKVLETHPQPVHLLDRSLPPAISHVVERALAKDKTARYQTSSEMLQAISGIRGSQVSAGAGAALTEPSVAKPAASIVSPPRSRTGSRPVAIMIAAAIAASVVVGGAAWMRKARDNRGTLAAAAPSGPSIHTPALPAPVDASPPPRVAPIPPPAPDAGRRSSSRAQARTRSEPSIAPPPADPGPGRAPSAAAADRPVAKPAPVDVAVPSPEPPPPPPISAPAAAAAPVPPAAAAAASADATRMAENAEDAVRAVLTKYQLALESRDIDALKRIWPALPRRQEDAIKTEFDRARGIAVRLDGVNVKITGGVAAVSCRRDYAVTTGDGQTLKTATEMMITMLRKNGAWTIDAVRHEVVR
jgi:eukaryotic-like serine/threonine-protein kinase